MALGAAVHCHATLNMAASPSTSGVQDRGFAGLVHQSLVGVAPSYLADNCRLLSDAGRDSVIHCGPIPMTYRSCSCREHICLTNLAIWVSRPQVPPTVEWPPSRTTAAGTVLRFLQTIRKRRLRKISAYNVSGVFRRDWVTMSANFKRKGRLSPTTVGVRKLEWLPFRAVSKYPQCVVWFCHKARVWHTDGRTDGRTELRLPKPALA